ncbi:MAG: invasion associated locus B family protein [Magnetococcales bacterium]|nr:invasion associated locus B family protein [Magnetococcales bacterium]
MKSYKIPSLFLALSLGLSAVAQAELTVGDKFGAWSFSCTAIGVDKTRCGLAQVVTSPNTGKNIVKVIFGQFGKNGEPALIIHTPINIFLDTSVLVKVDQGKQLKMRLQRCRPEGCIAALHAKPDFLKELATGTALKVGFVLWDKQKIPVVIPVPLNGIAIGMDKLKKESIPTFPKEGEETDLML